MLAAEDFGMSLKSTVPTVVFKAKHIRVIMRDNRLV